MLQSFREKINGLANDPKDPFRQTVIRLTGAREAARVESDLRQMVEALPDMLFQLARWSQDPLIPYPLRRLHLFTMAYLYNPEDLMPEKTMGLMGYVDDAYVVSRATQRTMDETGPVGLDPLRENPLVAMRVPGWVALARRLFPEMTERADSLLDDYVGTPDGKYRFSPAKSPSLSTARRKSKKEKSHVASL